MKDKFFYFIFFLISNKINRVGNLFLFHEEIWTSTCAVNCILQVHLRLFHDLHVFFIIEHS